MARDLTGNEKARRPPGGPGAASAPPVYNRTRRHSALGMLAPVAYENSTTWASHGQGILRDSFGPGLVVRGKATRGRKVHRKSDHQKNHRR